MSKSFKLYIARDENPSDEDWDIRSPGKLHLFYDKPLIQDGKFVCARQITEIPSYMYPNIKDGDCYEFDMDYSEQIYKEFEEL